jgi:hypothetical protein
MKDWKNASSMVKAPPLLPKGPGKRGWNTAKAMPSIEGLAFEWTVQQGIIHSPAEGI